LENKQIYIVYGTVKKIYKRIGAIISKRVEDDFAGNPARYLADLTARLNREPWR
jgi:hypothetical protein